MWKYYLAKVTLILEAAGLAECSEKHFIFLYSIWNFIITDPIAIMEFQIEYRKLKCSS